MSHYSNAHDGDPIFEDIEQFDDYLMKRAMRLQGEMAVKEQELHEQHFEVEKGLKDGIPLPVYKEKKLADREKAILDAIYPDDEFNPKIVDRPAVPPPLTNTVYDDIIRRFTYHAPKDDQPSRYNYLRNQALNLAVDIMRNCPESRECSLALTKLEEAIFWANASIARNE